MRRRMKTRWSGRRNKGSDVGSRASPVNAAVACMTMPRALLWQPPTQSVLFYLREDNRGHRPGDIDLARQTGVCFLRGI
jgi:hypothetical protein